MRRAAVALLLAVGSAAGCGVAEQAAREPFAEDLGPDRLEYEQLLKYPEEQQANYVLFAKRCSKCHTPARPLNSRFASREIWARYVTQMWRRPGSRITHDEARRIIDFLVYDAAVRKLDRREEFEAHRRRLLEEFKARHPDRYDELYAGHEEEAVRIR